MKKVATTAYAASLVASTVPVGLRGITIYNSNIAARFVQIHDAAALPADTAIPVFVFSVPASSSFSFDFGAPVDFNVGVVICNSTTAPTKTIGAADSWITAQLEARNN